MKKRYEDMNKNEKIDYLEDEIGRLTNKIESLGNDWEELRSYLTDEQRQVATQWILGKMSQIKEEKNKKAFLKSHQETGTTISKPRLKEIEEGVIKMKIQEMIKKYEDKKKAYIGKSKTKVEWCSDVIKELKSIEKSELTLQGMINSYEGFKQTTIRMGATVGGRRDLRPYENWETRFYDEVIKDLRSIEK